MQSNSRCDIPITSNTQRSYIEVNTDPVTDQNWKWNRVLGRSVWLLRLTRSDARFELLVLEKLLPILGDCRTSSGDLFFPSAHVVQILLDWFVEQEMSYIYISSLLWTNIPFLIYYFIYLLIKKEEDGSEI